MKAKVVGACAVVAGLLVFTAVNPLAAAVGAVGMCAAAIPAAYAWNGGDAIRRPGGLAGALLAACLALVLALVIAGLVIAVAVSPAATLLAAIVIAIIVLAWRSPALALGAAVLLFAFEGSVKILLGFDGVALPGGDRAAGAAALDIALAAAIAGVLFRDRLRAPRTLWSEATRAERVVIGAIGAWLALSVIQIAQGGDISRGVHAFRLFQWYTLVALAALTVFAQPQLRSIAVRVMLGIGLVVSLYSAVRVVIGPADAERAFARAVPTVTQYGGTFRAVGSFSSAIGLSSFLTPIAAFAFVLGLLRRDDRLLSWTVGVLALVGLIGSYSRASLFGVALGLAGGLVLVLVASRMSSRRRVVSAGLVIVILASTYAGLWAASQGSPELRERAKGVLNPVGDDSVQLRFETWRRTVDEAADHPLGQGVGAVGAASGSDVTQIRTTDNTFLKVLVEQGMFGLTLFVLGMLGAVVALARRLRGTADFELRSVGLAALAGYVAFLGICLAGESVEQPGKVVAWALLGMAAAHAYAGARTEGETA